MGIIVLLTYFLACIGAFVALHFLLKPKYIDSYRQDEILDTDNSTFSVYKPEERWKDYINEYIVYVNGEYKFVKITLTDKVQYINIQVVCYRNGKVYKIINLLNEIDKKQDEYLLKIPDGAEEVKVNVREVNGIPFFSDEAIDSKVFVRSIIASAIMGLASVLLYFLFRVATLDLQNDHYDWNQVYKVFFDEPWGYAVAAAFFLLVSFLMFISLFLPNSVKYKKARYNKLKKRNPKKAIKLVLKKKKRKKVIYYRVVYNANKKMKLKEANIALSCFDKDNNVVLEKEIKLGKKSHLVFHLGSKVQIDHIDYVIKTANFKKYYCNNNVFRKKLTKKGISCDFLTLKGLKAARAIFIVAILACSSYTIYRYVGIRNIDQDLQNFVFEKTTLSGRETYVVTKYKGKARKVLIPKSFNDIPVSAVGAQAFNGNLKLQEIYFSDEIRIEANAFSYCEELRKVDFDNVTYVGASAFYSSKLKEITLNHEMEIQRNAFSDLMYLDKVIVEDANIRFGSMPFSGSSTDYLEFHQGTNRFSSDVLSGMGIAKGYIFRDGLLAPTYTANNYSTYLGSSAEFVKVEDDCVHTNHSFILRNGRITENKSFKVKQVLQESTCVTVGLQLVICDYCGQDYQTGIALDPNNHDFGPNNEYPYCIDCGVENPDYVEPGEEENSAEVQNLKLKGASL